MFIGKHRCAFTNTLMREKYKKTPTSLQKHAHKYLGWHPNRFQRIMSIMISPLPPTTIIMRKFDPLHDWGVANAACAAMDGFDRLCTRDELATGMCDATGCSFDTMLVWTSEPCVCFCYSSTIEYNLRGRWRPACVLGLLVRPEGGSKMPA